VQDLPRLRTGHDVAAGDDQVEALGGHLGQSGLQSGEVPVDVRQDRDPHESMLA